MSRIFIDVTGTMAARFTSGIQRTVIQFAKRIRKDNEKVFLLKHVSSGSGYAVVSLEQLENRDREDREGFEQTIKLDSLQKGDIFLDLDSVWNLFEDRRQLLYPTLKKQGATIVSLVYDILPITHPQFFAEDTAWHFLIYLSSVLAYSDVIIVNSKATKKAIEDLAEDRRIPHKKIEVVPLGADFQTKAKKDRSIGNKILNAMREPYLLMLGTIEPRKNHKLLLDAFDEGLNRLPINILIAGRTGWDVDALVNRINGHPQFGKRVFLFENPSDDEVSELYRNAYGLVFASFGEGFGLPLIEALHYHKLVFASNIEVFREIGGDCCLYFDPEHPESLIRRVAETIAEPTVVERKMEQVSQYHVTSWDEAASRLNEIIDEIDSEMDRGKSLPEEVFQRPTQLFVITARMEDLLETFPFYEHFMPFIKEVVIGCPERLTGSIRKAYQGPLQLTFLTDESLLDGREMPADHQTRNTLLRALAMERDELNDVFIMGDDDNRPLCTIPAEYFVENQKFKLYYCCEDIRQWQPFVGGFTSYDCGIKQTAAFLSDHGMPFRQYSSHEPQIICKRVFLEAVKRFPEVLNAPIDEWSFYGNYAMMYYPDSFSSNLFTTMCWPALTTDWSVKTPPQMYLFENFYRHLYQKGELFEAFSTVYYDGIIEENLKKIQLRLAEQNKYDTGMAVSKVCDRLYFLTYHDDPGWEINVDELQIKLPKILMGKSGFVKKERLCIINHGEEKKRLAIRGQFVEKGTGRRAGFQEEELDITTMNGTYEIPVHLPRWEFTGALQLLFTLNEQETVSWEVPVMTF